MSFSSLHYDNRPRIDTNVHYPLYDNESGESYYSPTDLTQPTTPVEEELDEEEEELVTAMHDFVPDMPAATCLTFNAGQVIRVLNKDATGWWDGELVEPYPFSCTVTRGWFPSNYVSTDPILQSQQSQETAVSGFIHQRSTSLSSATSRASNATQSTTTNSISAPTLTQIPEILHPLLHSLSVLHGAAQNSKYQHYQPSAALIISGVRKILTDANCISKDSQPLRAHPELSSARAVLLSELADLVQHAKRAAAVSQERNNEPDWEDVGEGIEEEALESMLRMAGQVFTATRRFVKRLGECGVKVAAWEGSVMTKVTGRNNKTHRVESSASSSSGGTHSRTASESSLQGERSKRSWTNSSASENSDSGVQARALQQQQQEESRLSTPYGTPTLTQRGIAIGSPSQDDITVGGADGTSRATVYSYSSRARSMTDLRKHRYRAGAFSSVSTTSDTVDTLRQHDSTHSHPQTHSRYPAQKSVDSTGSAHAPLLPKAESLTISNAMKHKKKYSVASASSSSSWSSYATPPTPDFPSGICTTEQIRTHLRITQDSLLSSIAAFIGHIYNHSRLAHSTSKGHIINYGIEIVEKVKAMLSLIDNILKQPEIVKLVASNKRASLGDAKHSLYLVTNELVTYVRAMTVAHNRDISDAEEEAEKNKTLNAATGVHRAAQECTKCANVVLTRANGEKSFMIHLPEGNEQSSLAPAVRKTGLGPLREYETCDETLVGESATETVSETEVEIDRDPVAQPRQVAEEPESLTESPEAEVEAEAHRSQEQDDTITADNVQEPQDPREIGDHLSAPSMISTTSVEILPIPASTEDFDYGGNDDSIVSFPTSEEGSAYPDDEGEELVASVAPSGDRDVNYIVVHPPDSSVAHSDIQTLESGTTHVSTLEEKILYGNLPSVPLSSSSSCSTFPSSTELADIEKEEKPEPQTGKEQTVSDVVYNNDGLVIGATLKALVQKMTSPDSLAEASFSSVFFLTFRFFATPDEILDELITRFNTVPTEIQTPDALAFWRKTKGFAIKVRVLNIMKSWLELYWRPEKDNDVLKRMFPFVQADQARENAGLAGLADRILDLVKIRMFPTETPGHSKTGSSRSKAADRLRELGNQVSPVSPSEIPRPQITKSLFNVLRSGDFSNVVVTDFDALELARQLTVLESRLYRAVLPDELLEAGRSGSSTPANVKAITSLSTAIAGWVTESILGELDTKKRATLLKFFIKVADRCSRLNNFATPRSILAALDSANISRLQQTWAVIPQKQKVQFDALRKLADYSRNFAEYRSRLRNTVAPAVPFLGLYLTDLTFCRDGHPSHRPHPSAPEKQLINFNKYYKLARIVQDMQRFQTPYTLKEISEVQQYLAFVLQNTRSEGDLQDLYRRSLVVEPRQPTEEKSGEIRFFGWATRSSSNSPSVQHPPQPLH